MTPDKALWKASAVFAPDYPRQASSANTIQATRYDRASLCEALQSTRDGGMPGYYSVYSFPRGHSRDQNIPKVDCIFIDLDVEGGDYNPNEGRTEFEAWERDMSALLARARMIAQAIIDDGQREYFRATLSGHKGLHLYLDFPTISANNGSFEQFKAGLKEYGEKVMEGLDSMAGGVNIDPWVDVDASDLGRLARHPNTVHHGAAYDDKRRWCVPVTLEELADLHVDDYLELTEGPRWPDDYSRTPSETAGKRVVQTIRNASVNSLTGAGGKASYDPQAVEKYEEESEDIDLEDIEFLTANKPCIKAFRERDDAFDHGNASHVMEINIMSRFVEMGVPRDVIHEWFAEIPGYDEEYTDEQIDKIIGLQYEKFNCNKVADDATTFCLGEQCGIYQRSDDIQK